MINNHTATKQEWVLVLNGSTVVLWQEVQQGQQVSTKHTILVFDTEQEGIDYMNENIITLPQDENPL